MKTIILILLCLTLTSAAGLAKDYHLVQTYIVDSGAPSPGAGKQAVYVLVPPDNSSRAVVFQTFDSKEMEAWLSGGGSELLILRVETPGRFCWSSVVF
jgi:hypothetical protein